MADTAITELVRHSVAEEMYVYPAMREHLPDGDKAVEHDIEEHKELERTMKELEGVRRRRPRASWRWCTSCGVRSTTTHRRGDRAVPAAARPRTARGSSCKMREQVETAKRLAPTRPHPGAPNSELFHKLVGPGVGLMDRVRDKLTGRTTP